MTLISFSNDRIFEELELLADEIILPRYQKLAADEKREKTPGDFVTIVDEEMEAELEKFLLNLVPNSVIIGEEAVSKNPKIINSVKNNELVWFVDPLDGTNNFTHGNSNFCTMISLIYRGEIIGGWVYSPLSNEKLSAEKNSGCYLNGQKVLMNKKNDLQAMFGQMNLHTFPKEDTRNKLKEKNNNTPLNLKRLGCAGQDFLNHAKDKRHFSLYRKLAPWDFTPGFVILSEAGGKMATLDNEKPNPFCDTYGILTAVSESDWDLIRDYLKVS